MSGRISSVAISIASSLAEAREAALANRKLARAGGDPLQAKRQAAAVLTFEEAARRAHAEISPAWKNPKDRAAFLTSMETYMFPTLGRMKVSEVASSHVRQAILAARKLAPGTARKLVFRTSAIFKWPIAEGMRTDNPARSDVLALPRDDSARKPRKALPYDAVPDCLATLRASGAGLSTKLALEFLVLTAGRPGSA